MEARIQAIEIMAELEDVQAQLDATKETVESIIQKLMGGGEKI